MDDTDRPVLETATLRRDLYVLLSLLLADEKIADLQRITEWATGYYENEVNRLSVWAAVALRGLLDLAHTAERIARLRCGEYWAYHKSPRQTALTFRQACNSLIHAREILPYRAGELGRVGANRYIDRITVRGNRFGKPTTATIDIMQFVQIASDLLDLIEETHHAN